jgi:hypothetical protein
MPALSEWLQLMLAEIARKREEADRASDEEAKRSAEDRPRSQPPERRTKTTIR